MDDLSDNELTDIPILIRNNKLKSLDFANRQSFLFNSFKDIDDVAKNENIDPFNTDISKNAFTNLSKSFKHNSPVVKKDLLITSKLVNSKNSSGVDAEETSATSVKKYFIFMYQ
jgi:hypothetical protein